MIRFESGGIAYAPHRARIDTYNVAPCGWSAISQTPGPWIQVDSSQKYVVRGILIKDRCDSTNQLRTRTTVQMSEDGGSWDDVMVEEDILSLYRPSVYGKTVTTWFAQPSINQY